MLQVLSFLLTSRRRNTASPLSHLGIPRCGTSQTGRQNAAWALCPGLSKGANGPLSQQWNTQMVRCCSFNTGIFVFFFHFGRMPLSLFVKFVAGLTTKCPVKENLWSRKGGFNWTPNDGNAHPHSLSRSEPPSMSVSTTLEAVSLLVWHRSGQYVPRGSAS